MYHIFTNIGGSLDTLHHWAPCPYTNLLLIGHANIPPHEHFNFVTFFKWNAIGSCLDHWLACWTRTTRVYHKLKATCTLIGVLPSCEVKCHIILYLPTNSSVFILHQMEAPPIKLVFHTLTLSSILTFFKQSFFALRCHVS